MDDFVDISIKNIQDQVADKGYSRIERRKLIRRLLQL